MSNYSTGELAKLCNVTTRTIQYYDRKGILKPQGFTEGKR
ncbi:MerR family DNA-binding transcriptional regulator, partial [Staphylococcus aureus]